MNPERWQSCTDIFNVAVEQTSDERAAFLERSCDGDEALRRKVELLLKYHDTSGDFIKSPAFEAAPELLAGDPEGLIGQHLGCYRVNAVAGVGGMGVVYLAWDERLARKVALKLLPQSMVANEAELARLKREARTASALNHPNIVTIHDIGEVDSTYYVATEFIEGTTLRGRMTKGPIPPNEAVDIATQVASVDQRRSALAQRERRRGLGQRKEGPVTVEQPRTSAGRRLLVSEVAEHLAGPHDIDRTSVRDRGRCHAALPLRLGRRPAIRAAGATESVPSSPPGRSRGAGACSGNQAARRPRAR